MALNPTSSRFRNEHEIDHNNNMGDAPPSHDRRPSTMAHDLIGGVPGGIAPSNGSLAKPRPTTAARPTGMYPSHFVLCYTGPRLLTNFCVETGWRKRMGGGARIVSHLFNAQNYTRKEIPGDELVTYHC
jgi:hypothetical protein